MMTYGIDVHGRCPTYTNLVTGEDTKSTVFLEETISTQPHMPS